MELKLELKDTEWPLEYIDHDRNIARAIVVDNYGYYYYNSNIFICFTMTVTPLTLVFCKSIS